MGNLESLRLIVANLHVEPLMPGEIRADHLRHSPFARVRLCPQGYVGIRKEGAEAFSDLALALFQNNPAYRRGCKLEELTTSLFGILLEKFSTRTAKPITPRDLAAVEQAIADWFKAHAFSYHFFIPCVLTPRKAPPFAIGPVSFLPLEDFIIRQQQQLQEDFEMLMGTMIRDMRTQRADWIAEVDVHDSQASRAEELGNVAVDIALTAVQLAAHPEGMLHHLARMTSRTTTAFKVTPSRRSDGRLATSVTSTQPGLLLLEGNLQTILRNNADLLRTLGAQIDTFLNGSGFIPILAQSLVDAAYWAHEAFAEPLDTIAVPKLETTMEVLLRAESASGAITGLRQAIRAFYGLHESDLINPYSQTTVKRFVDDLVTDRSRILHGTWSTLNDTLEAGREGLQNFVIDLLKRYILAVGDYISTGSPTDNHAAFLAYVERQQKTRIPE
jgi:hypothetical protein